ncbi:glycosyltransferase family 4 protein [Diaporthe amygdali]|uniref:glycosyltransferase family 4 protein n=1 Tax=Phomopsis amygdali TaxID=1214568 RepID=UPI0022FF391A|nr:glycosyltransferase family 4 protein [Diaporthe amygdali]KAJ0125071.1 glycosyltransferase family 4 protein [Diaporthe amygdali]
MAETTATGKKKTIVFFHPDLGIGGAERLVVDAAVGLQNRGHKVIVFTSHCDPKHCFDEARDGTLEVRVRGNTIFPPSIFSKLSILCAIARQLHLLVQIRLNGELASLRPDAFFVDQLSAGLPLLQFLQPKAPILFYCHFPDLHLVQGRDRWLKKLYRLPFDTLERCSMGFADAIAVNSKFTRGVVSRTWPSLARSRDLKVVYPCIDIRPPGKGGEGKDGGLIWEHGDIILSINRYERKKDIALAIKAYAGLPKHKRNGVKLVIAGGYDSRVSENVSYHKELVELAQSLKLTEATVHSAQTALAVPAEIDVIFLLSVTNALKQQLLRSARLLVYTPSNEHFGIVPLEAMLARAPVLAANTGGPTETVVEGETGWLRDPEDVAAWTKVMGKVLGEMSQQQLEEMGRKGDERVRTQFADTQMAERLDKILRSIENPQREGSLVALLGFLGSGALVFFVLAALGVLAAMALTQK